MLQKCAGKFLLVTQFEPALRYDGTMEETLQRMFLKAHFQRHHYAEFNVASWNRFLREQAPQLTADNRKCVLYMPETNELHTLALENLRFQRPMHSEVDEQGNVIEERRIMPAEALQRNFTYAGSALIDVVHRIQHAPPDDIRFSDLASVSPNMDFSDLQVTEHRIAVEKTLTSLPVMVGCDMCWTTQEPTLPTMDANDRGGYFIIFGNERVVQPAEDLRYNCVITSFAQGASSTVEVYCEVRSRHEEKHRSSSNTVLVLYKSDDSPSIYGVIPFTEKYEFPIAVLFRFLGIKQRRDAELCVFPAAVLDDENAPEAVAVRALRNMLAVELKAFPGRKVWDLSDRDLYTYMATETNRALMPFDKLYKNLNHIKSSEFLPHLGLTNDHATRLKKACYLGRMMVRRMLRVKYGIEAPDDRDHMALKRIQGPGPMFAHVLRQLLRKTMKMARTALMKSLHSNKRALVNPGDLMPFERIISRQVNSVFQTGTWTADKAHSHNSREGVSQILSRNNPVAAITHIQRINNPLQRQGRIVEPRFLHYSQYGLVCPFETPEDDSVGLLKNPAIFAYIRTGHDVRWLKATLYRDYGVVPLERWLASVLSLRDDDVRALNKSAREALAEEVAEEEGAAVASAAPAASAVVAEPTEEIAAPLVGMENLQSERLLLVNDDIVGVIPEDADAFASRLRRDRRHGLLPFDISIVQKPFGVSVHVDPGCMMRPLIVLSELSNLRRVLADLAERVSLRLGEATGGAEERKGHEEEKGYEEEKGKEEEEGGDDEGQSWADLSFAEWSELASENAPFMSSLWDHLCENGIIEYVDKEEEAQGLVAPLPDNVTPQHTHLEVHPLAVMGLAAACIPFSNHNQSPRNTYQAAMGKQAIGRALINVAHRLDAHMHESFYTQAPLSRSVIEDAVPGLAELPCGTNCVVAVLTNTGLNQEDSLLISKTFVDMGGFRSFYYTRVHEDERVGDNEAVRIENPMLVTTCAVMNLKMADYSKLDASGVVEVGTRVVDNDVLIGMTKSTLRADSATLAAVKTDVSYIYNSSEPAVVDRVVVTTNKFGMKSVKVMLRQLRIPIIGDKLSSRSGQKGTIGLVVPREDLPFNCDGISPDIVINPHCIPSRMTIGKLMEMLLGKLCAVVGSFGDATPFRGVKTDDIASQLRDVGFSPHGDEVMYDGMTGTLLQARVFVGVCFYQRLRHMVLDKWHARKDGPVSNITRQPNEGRSRQGGLRVGEMERDVFIAHGAAEVLRDRMLYSSDDYFAPVCPKCGSIGDNMHDRTFGSSVTGKLPWCRACKTECHLVRMPYSLKTTTQEAAALGVKMGFEIESRPLQDSVVLPADRAPHVLG